ncbi:transposase, partial [Xanthomonas phaseoli]
EAAFFIAAKRPPNQAIGNKRERAREERWEHFKASVRAKVEHPFRVIKRQFGYTKVRYRGLAKNTAWQLKPPESCRNRTKRSILHVAAVQEAGI